MGAPELGFLPANRVLLLILVALVAFLVFRSLGADPRSDPDANQVAFPATAAAPTPPTPAPATAPASLPATPSPELPAHPPVIRTNPPASPRVLGAPTSASAVAGLFGGSPSEWMKEDADGRTVGDNGWIFRSFGSDVLDFTVPAGTVVDTPAGRLYPSEQVHTTDLTIYWGVA